MEQYEKLLSADEMSFLLNGNTIDVQMHVTGIDGKVRNFITGNESSCSCGICGLRPTQLGGDYLHHVDAVPTLKDLLLGCSPLHLHLRTMETLINMGVRRQLGGNLRTIWKIGILMVSQGSFDGGYTQ